MIELEEEAAAALHVIEFPYSFLAVALNGLIFFWVNFFVAIEGLMGANRGRHAVDIFFFFFNFF